MDKEIIDILKKHGCLYMASDYKELLMEIQNNYKQKQALQLLQTDVSNNKVAVAFVKWLTEKDSKYAILYGGTPELEKDYRLATLEDDYTIEEVFKEFKKATDY